MSESRLQSEVVKFLKKRGCYVIKTKPGPGIPTGCPDVFAVLDGFWLALEIKADKQSKFQPLQKETIHKLDKWSYAKVVYPENWPEIQAELEKII